MGAPLSPIQTLRQKYHRGEADPVVVATAALARANSNAGRNVYLARDEEWTREQARALRREDLERQPLWGVPVSLKDCFNLEGFPTSCGSRFYLDRNGIATADSAVATRLQAAGAVIVGKTHLHQIAYGMTGENADFGDCVQPRNEAWLTGGSSSGAAASIQEGSAMAAIGTDTGGSIRIPAALCGLAGYRASLALGGGLWAGGAHLAPTFDTLGWLFRDLRDAPVLAEALFGLEVVADCSIAGRRVGVPDDPFLRDAERAVSSSLQERMAAFEAAGATVTRFDAAFWEDALAVVSPIQAAEAAANHAGNFDHLEPGIAARLRWGAAFSAAEIAAFRQQRAEFCGRMKELFERFDYLLLPSSPLAVLLAGADHTDTRALVLRYTAPMSLAGLPVVTLPDGMQLVGPSAGDAPLLALAAALGEISAEPWKMLRCTHEA